jgi:superfamily II DNA or RNA helicase
MAGVPDFVQAFRAPAEALIASRAIQEPLFSRGTYQFEVREAKKKEEDFPFLQLSDEGGVRDCFCTCAASETGRGCPHLAAAFLKIFNGYDKPLHIRFRDSLWNHLFQMAGKRHGYDTKCLHEQEGGRYVCESKTRKKLFSIQATGPAKKRLTQIIGERVIETEETSIKFSNLSAEEIAQYRAGEASHELRYELSFWSDLAKWLMFLEEEKEPYEIQIQGKKHRVPTEIALSFPQLGVWFYISEVNWPSIIPALATVKAPLQVYEEHDHSIGSVSYDPKAQRLSIQRRGSRSGESDFRGIQVGEWLYVEGKGFYRRRLDPILEQESIAGAQIGEVLSRSYKTLQTYLPIEGAPRPARYRLFFDDKNDLHIQLYVEVPEDLSQSDAALFAPWAYIPGRGFFLLQDLLFAEIEKVVPRKEVADFVSRHRLWLHNFPGFQTHLGSMEAHLTYFFTEEGDLTFSAELNFPEQFEETTDFDEWVYIKGSGFYMKKESRGRLPLHPGLTLKKEEIASFLASHKEDLEQVHGFFSPEPLVKRTGLQIGLNDSGSICLTPKMEFAEGVVASEVKIFGDFVYWKGKGFSEIHPHLRLPERYRTGVVIPPIQEPAFLAYELEPLQPYLIEIAPQLRRPEHLRLKIRKVMKDRKRRSQEWLVDLIYESELGAVDIFPIWDTFQGRKKHLFSAAGLLWLKEPRFHWLRQIPKRRLDRKKGMIRFSTLEWIRLMVFEEIHAPQGNEPDAALTRRLLQEIQRFESTRVLNIARLKSTLRPYQESGLQWLWFLYCHGLSGLLCDDMGLGKTHQAMALLAAAMAEDPDRDNKYLVVCPTSVIYHWQELLKRFLPDLRISTYYGLERTLETFEENYDLLLTSYGILRTGRDDLRVLNFELAIFDEIQIAKNSASQTHLALRKLNGKMKLGLTGTPIENRLRELKSLFDIVLPGYMPPDPVFRDLFVTPIEKLRDEGQKALLHKLIKPFILRRKKSEVLKDLPEKIEEIAYCDLSEEQKELYTETAYTLRETLVSDLKDPAKPVPYVHVFSALSRLKQICNHPSLITKDPVKYQDHQSGKWDLFVELLYEARDSGQKVVVFSQYLDMLAIIEEYLKKKGIGFASIKGSTRDRSDQLRRFREDPGCEIFLASLLAAGVGIDLTVASIVIHYDRWWNPAKENQATDRVHRIGQNRGVQVFKLVTKNTVEEHIHQLIEKKKGLLEEVVGQDDVDQIRSLSREELIEIFESLLSS